MPKYSNPEDITTGTQPLKGVRNSDLYNQEDSSDVNASLREALSRAQRDLWRSQTGRSGAIHVGEPGFMEGYYIPEGEPGSEYGNSRFDRGLMVAPTEEDIVNQRAENQTNVGKFLNGLSKGAVLAGTTFLDGTLGLAFGVVDATQAGLQGDKEWYARLWDNSVSNGLQQINQLSEEAMPNYRSTEEMNRSWIQNLGTVNFWADSFLKNMGFTVGAFYSGGAFNQLLKGAKLIKSGVGAAAAGSIYSAINEGRIEANNNVEDWKNLQLQQIDDEYNRQVNTLASMGVSGDRLNQEISRLNDARQNAIAAVQDNASAVGLIDLGANIAILGATNLLTYGRVYAKGFETAKQQAAKMGTQVSRAARRQAVDKAFIESEGTNLGKQITRDGAKYKWNDITKGKVLFNGARTALREGNEEMAQAMAAEFAGQVYTPDSPETYYRIGQDPTAKATTDDLFNTLITSFMNTYGDGDRYEEFAIGALTGILGMPTFGARNNASADTYIGRGKRFGITGGVLGERASAREMNEQGKTAVDKMNEFIDKFNENKIPFYRRNSLSNAMDGWVKQDNKFEYKNAEDNDLFETIAQFSKMGKLKDLKDMIQDGFYNVTDEQLESIATSFSPTDVQQQEGEASGYRDSNGDLLSDTDEGRALMRDVLRKSGDTILRDIDDYENSLQYIRNISGNSMDEARTTELAWMKWKLGKFNSRYSSIVSENEADIRDFVTNANTRIEILDKEIEDKRNNKAEKEALDALTAERTMLADSSDFAKRILEAPDIQKFILALPQQAGQYLAKVGTALFSLAQDGNIAAPGGFLAALDTFSDMPAIIGAWNTFNTTLTDYLKNPTKLDAMHQKVDNEKKAVNTAKAKQDVVNKNQGKSAQELADMDDALFAELDGLDDIPEDLQQKKAEAESIRQDAAAVVSAVGSNDEFSDEDKAALNEMLSGRSTSEIAELLNPEAEISPEELENFDVDDELQELRKQIASGEIPELSDEEVLAEKVRMQEEKARKLLDSLRASVDAGKAESASMPRAEKPSQNASVPALTPEQMKVLTSYAMEFGQQYIDSAITEGSKSGLAEQAVLFFKRIRTWKLTDPDNLWALIHADGVYQAEVDASGTPAVDEAVIKEFLNDKTIFGEVKPRTVQAPVGKTPQRQAPTVSPSSPTPSPSPSAAPAPATREVVNEFEPQQKATSVEAGVTPFTREVNTVDRKLTFDAQGRLQDPEVNGYSAERNAELRERKLYLQNVGAFAARYNGLVYAGKPVHFEIRPDAVRAVGKTVILIVDSDGNVLGDMAPSWALGNSPALQAWTAAKEKEYQSYVSQQRAAGQDVETYRLKEETTIKNGTPGAVPYITRTGSNDVTQTLNSVFTINGKATPFVLATVNNVSGKWGLTFGKNAPEDLRDVRLDDRVTSTWRKGDVVLLLPTGLYEVSEGGTPKMQYTVVPLSNVESVFRGEERNPITRIFNAWGTTVRNTINASEARSTSGEEFKALVKQLDSLSGELAKALNSLFGAPYGFHVDARKENRIWNFTVERTTHKFFSIDNFAGNVNRQRDEDKEGLRERLAALGMTADAVETLISNVLNAKNATEAREFLATVPVPEGTRLSYNKDKNGVTIGIVQTLFSSPVNDPSFEAALAQTFVGARIAVSAAKLNSQMEFLGQEISYNQLVGGSLRLNMAPGVGRTVNSFFELEGFEMSKEVAQPAPQQAPQPVAATTVAEAPKETGESEVFDNLSRADMIARIQEELGANGALFIEQFGDHATDEDLRKILLLDVNKAEVLSALSAFDEDIDEAEEFWTEVSSRLQDRNPEPASAPAGQQESKPVEASVTIKDAQGREQTYIVSGEVIRNKDGKEVFAKSSRQRSKILREAEVAAGLAVKNGNDYITRDGRIYAEDGTEKEVLVPKLRATVEGGAKFADGTDLSSLYERAYGWQTLTDDERTGFQQQQHLTGLEITEKTWNESSIEDRINFLQCYAGF